MNNEITIIDDKVVEDIPFTIFSNCLPVKGASRSAIYDLLREQFIFIPNTFYELIKSQKFSTIIEIKNHFNNDYNTIIDEYFSLLMKYEMVFFTNSPELFPTMDLNWDEPFPIVRTIIDFSTAIRHQKKSY